MSAKKIKRAKRLNRQVCYKVEKFSNGLCHYYKDFERFYWADLENCHLPIYPVDYIISALSQYGRTDSYWLGLHLN